MDNLRFLFYQAIDYMNTQSLNQNPKMQIDMVVFETGHTYFLADIEVRFQEYQKQRFFA